MSWGYAVSNRVVVADNNQVLILTSSHCALVQRVNDAHVCFLLEAQETRFVELHAITTIRTNTDHGPYDKCDLKDKMLK